VRRRPPWSILAGQAAARAVVGAPTDLDGRFSPARHFELAGLRAILPVPLSFAPVPPLQQARRAKSRHHGKAALSHRNATTSRACSLAELSQCSFERFCDRDQRSEILPDH
jgi:hypothetical protein